MNIHYEILDEQRKSILPLFSGVRELGFYLAGGTALALQLGHRDSIDFDFFTENQFSTEDLFKKVEDIFSGHVLVRTQEEKNTLSILVDDKIRLSFMTFPYLLINPLYETDEFSLASLIDIGCMKLNAITSRSAYKDYVDLFFVLQQIDLKELLTALTKKMPNLDPLLALKSLVYFDDIQYEEILYKTEPIPYETIKSVLTEKVKKYEL